MRETKIFCGNTDCKYCDPANDFVCCNGAIILSDEYFGGCSDYESYSSNKEYQEPFYVILSDGKGKPWAKAIRYGKRIEKKAAYILTATKLL